MYDRRLTDLFTVYCVFSVWLIFCLKTRDWSPCLCNCITKQRQSSGRRDKGHALSLSTTGFISVYPDLVLSQLRFLIWMGSWSQQAPYQNPQFRSDKKTQNQKVSFVFLNLIISAERRNHGNFFFYDDPVGRAEISFKTLLYFITASLFKRQTCSSFSLCVVIKYNLGNWKLLLSLVCSFKVKAVLFERF